MYTINCPPDISNPLLQAKKEAKKTKREKKKRKKSSSDSSDDSGDSQGSPNPPKRQRQEGSPSPAPIPAQHARARHDTPEDAPAHPRHDRHKEHPRERKQDGRRQEDLGRRGDTGERRRRARSPLEDSGLSELPPRHGRGVGDADWREGPSRQESHRHGGRRHSRSISRSPPRRRH
jgi:hypothetical protein